jgi:hypothetical protein
MNDCICVHLCGCQSPLSAVRNLSPSFRSFDPAHFLPSKQNAASAQQRSRGTSSTHGAFPCASPPSQPPPGAPLTLTDRRTRVPGRTLPQTRKRPFFLRSLGQWTPRHPMQQNADAEAQGDACVCLQCRGCARWFSGCCGFERSRSAVGRKCGRKRGTDLDGDGGRRAPVAEPTFGFDASAQGRGRSASPLGEACHQEPGAFSSDPNNKLH